MIIEINLQTIPSIPSSPMYNVGRSLQVLRTLLSPANNDLGGGGGRSEGGGVENSDKHEK